MDGSVTDEIKTRARDSKFDERLALISLLFSAVSSDMKSVIMDYEALDQMKNELSGLNNILRANNNYQDVFNTIIADIEKQIKNGKTANNITYDDIAIKNKTIKLIDSIKDGIEDNKDISEILKHISDIYNNQTEKMKRTSLDIDKRTQNMFDFCAEVFGEGEEMVIIVTEMTINKYTSSYIGRFGCESYFKYNKSLLFYERERDIQKVLKSME